MAKFCKDIVCGKKYIYKSDKSELMCRCDDEEEQLMPICAEFDATLANNGDIHIVAVDEKGNLVYIKNSGRRWGRGVVAEKVEAENVFIIVDDENINLYYTNESEFLKLIIDDEIQAPTRIGSVENSGLTFVDGNEAYYVNKKHEVISESKGVVYSGKNISFIFVLDNSICLKDEKELKLIDVENNNECKSLTRRHETGAGCPVFANKNGIETLFWIDGEKLYSAKKQGEVWQRLETEKLESFDKVGIFKFCDSVSVEYTIGCVKHSKPERWGENSGRADEFAETYSCSDAGKSKIMEDFHNRLNMEIIMNEIRGIHEKILDIDKKIEKIKKNHALQIVSEISRRKENASLYKMHKK